MKSSEQQMYNNNNNEQGNNSQSLSIFVGGLKANFTEDVLFKYFGSIGEVESINLKKNKKTNMNKGYCIVTFKDIKSVKRVLKVKDHFIDRRLVTCRPFLRGEKLKKSKAQKNNKKIYICGLPSKTRNSHIHQLFKRFGKIETGYTLIDEHSGESKGFGFVSFEEEGVIEEILKSHTQLEILGVKIKVERFVARVQDNNECFGEGVQERSGQPGKMSARKVNLNRQSGSFFLSALNPLNYCQKPNQVSSFRKRNSGVMFPRQSSLDFNIGSNISEIGSGQDQQRNNEERGNIFIQERHIRVERRNGIVRDNRNSIPSHPALVRKSLEEHQQRPTQSKYHNSMSNMAKAWHDINISNIKFHSRGVQY